MADLSGGKGSEARRGPQAVVVAGRERGRREVVKVLHGGGVPAMNRVIFETGDDHVAQRLEKHLEREREFFLIDREVSFRLIFACNQPYRWHIGATHVLLCFLPILIFTVQAVVCHVHANIACLGFSVA